MVTVQAAALVAGVDESTMRRALASGRVKGTKPGRDWLVDADSAAAFQRKRKLSEPTAV
jgi:excisionase family DNA binding protein